MIDIYKWRLFCENENCDIFVYSREAPTICPHGSHEVREGSISCIEKIDFIKSPTTDMPLTQKEKDEIRFWKRAHYKDTILSEIAADNMSRLRSGAWTPSQLISLTQDVQLKDLLDDINTLSFEIAYSKVDGLTNSLLTTEIKNVWKAKLYANFFIE